MKKTNKGFTLVELIIVIAVIGVLAAILIPVFSNVIEKANTKSAFSDAKNALSIFLADQTTGENGGNVVDNGTVFEVAKAGKNFYFTYNNNGLTENDDINTKPTVGAVISATAGIEGFPTNVTMYKAA